MCHYRHNRDKASILKALEQLKAKYPHIRIGQAISNAMALGGIHDLFYLTDLEFEVMMERYLVWQEHRRD